MISSVNKRRIRNFVISDQKELHGFSTAKVSHIQWGELVLLILEKGDCLEC